jgi:hypothetical protein
LYPNGKENERVGVTMVGVYSLRPSMIFLLT